MPGTTVPLASVRWPTRPASRSAIMRARVAVVGGREGGLAERQHVAAARHAVERAAPSRSAVPAWPASRRRCGCVWPAVQVPVPLRTRAFAASRSSQAVGAAVVGEGDGRAELGGGRRRRWWRSARPARRCRCCRRRRSPSPARRQRCRAGRPASARHRARRPATGCSRKRSLAAGAGATMSMRKPSTMLPLVTVCARAVGQARQRVAARGQRRVGEQLVVARLQLGGLDDREARRWARGRRWR